MQGQLALHLERFYIGVYAQNDLAICESKALSMLLTRSKIRLPSDFLMTETRDEPNENFKSGGSRKSDTFVKPSV